MTRKRDDLVRELRKLADDVEHERVIVISIERRVSDFDGDRLAVTWQPVEEADVLPPAPSIAAALEPVTRLYCPTCATEGLRISDTKSVCAACATTWNPDGT